MTIGHPIRLTDRHPIDENGCRTFYEIGTGKITKILATDEAAILKLLSAKAPFTSQNEKIFMRIDEQSRVDRLWTWAALRLTQIAGRILPRTRA